MRLRALLVCLALVGSATTACAGDSPPPDAYQDPVPACDLMPDDTVADLVNQAGASHSVPPDAAAHDSEVLSDCRWDFFEQPGFDVWVTLQVARFPSRAAAKTGAAQARYWLTGYGTLDIANAPPLRTRVTPPPVPSAHSAADLGFEAATIITQQGKSALHAVDGNLGVAIVYNDEPTVGAYEVPDDLDWQVQEATFRLAKGISASLRHHRR